MDYFTYSGQLTTEIMKVLEWLPKEEFEKVSNHVYNTLESVNTNERMSEDYCAVNEYKALMQERYKAPIDWFEEKYPNGIYTKVGDHEVGLNIITKKFIAEILEIQLKLNH